MKTITFKKQIEVDAIVEFPIITFIGEKVRVSTGDSSWADMGYVPRFNGLTKKEYHQETGMKYRDIESMLEEYMVETFGLNKGLGACGRITWYVYSAKELGMPELPKVNAEFNDDHADLVKMFVG
jgi:hypothetical protein